MEIGKSINRQARTSGQKTERTVKEGEDEGH